MNCDLRSWTIEYPGRNEDIDILKECCQHNDEISMISNEKLIHFKDKLPPPFYNAMVSSYLLDKSKSHYCVLEKYVYDIALFHLDRLGFLFDNDDIHIQFWMKSGKNGSLIELHRDWYTDYEKCDEKRAFLSTITYLEDNDIPTLITDATIKEHKERKLDQLNNIALSFPRTGKHISFLGRDYFHGHYAVFPETNYTASRNVLVIKLWHGPKPNLRYFDNELFLLDNNYSKNEVLLRFSSKNDQKHVTSSRLINETLFSQLLYSAKSDTCYKIGELIARNGYPNSNTFIIEKGTNFFYIFMFILCFSVIVFYFWNFIGEQNHIKVFL